MSSDGWSGAPARRRYTPEQRAEAVRLVRLRRAETGELYGSVKAVAEQLDYGVESVRNWVHRAETDAGDDSGRPRWMPSGSNASSRRTGS